jgi:hypothetical protein
MRLNRLALAAAVTFFAVAPVAFAQTTQTTPRPASPPATGSTTGAATRAPVSAAANQYRSEAEAKTGCGADPVVWGNTASHVLHKAGTRYYGKTKSGAYMCEGDATKAGYHEAKNSQ